jgi:2-methylisocitrate lyase-like PEP mutase family enzyme
LHQKPERFVIPNPWDRGSAMVLESMGFKALAWTEAGYAFSLGKPDLAVSAREMLGYFKDLCDVTNLPASADMQHGFGDSPDDAALIIIEAAKAGLVGGSLARAAFSALKSAGTELLEYGTLNYSKDAMPGKDLNALFT